MGIYTIRMPDIGEGIAEAELVEWHVNTGDDVAEDQTVAVVMTDKAAVEVPSSVSGKVSWLGGDIGDLISVGGKLIQLEVDGEGNDTEAETHASTAPNSTDQSPNETVSTATNVRSASIETASETATAVTNITNSQESTNKHKHEYQARVSGAKPLAAPSVRARAKEEGVDLRNVPGSGPAGRINHQDLSDYLEGGSETEHREVGKPKNTAVNEVKVVGMRRKIAEKMALSKARIPHITIVEEVDMTELEDLRSALNQKHKGERPKLTMLPFIMRAIVEAVREQPELNARYDDEAEVVHQFGGVHIGIATQTKSGLNVAVAHHCEAGNLWENAAEISRLAEAARDGSIKREELTGSSITVTSLGSLGALATTPIINYPEVAIVGINKLQIRPMWDGQQFQPSKMMNISCSFDHRVVDGWDAAVFVQKLKALLEAPAMLFVEG